MYVIAACTVHSVLFQGKSNIHTKSLVFTRNTQGTFPSDKGARAQKNPCHFLFPGMIREHLKLAIQVSIHNATGPERQNPQGPRTRTKQ